MIILQEYGNDLSSANLIYYSVKVLWSSVVAFV